MTENNHAAIRLAAMLVVQYSGPFAAAVSEWLYRVAEDIEHGPGFEEVSEASFREQADAERIAFALMEELGRE